MKKKGRKQYDQFSKSKSGTAIFIAERETEDP